ncbi:hypothetical protein SKAU_G00336690 [Synaphobranchus kaupii]|uniref:Uncharacterized protein n=1 Tax=Synaphobranchus kaupii TaxID=118154 RepID=A0A9Q1EM87_SYNKA|nr:hypothetical protein SKAU_G00336690 [Synaphobranchus kaupii]
MYALRGAGGVSGSTKEVNGAASEQRCDAVNERCRPAAHVSGGQGPVISLLIRCRVEIRGQMGDGEPVAGGLLFGARRYHRNLQPCTASSY